MASGLKMICEAAADAGSDPEFRSASNDLSVTNTSTPQTPSP